MQPYPEFFRLPPCSCDRVSPSKQVDAEQYPKQDSARCWQHPRVHGRSTGEQGMRDGRADTAEWNEPADQLRRSYTDSAIINFLL